MSVDHRQSAGRPWSRREMLQRTALGFGAFAMSGLDPLKAASRVLGPARPRKIAKHVIFLYMDGGVSQVDSFDPKPLLDKEDGNPMGIEMPATQFDDVGRVLKSPWKFKPGGECGTPVSENENLPGYIVLDGGLIPPGGLDCFGSGFLPAEFQASVLRPERADLLPNLKPREPDERQRRKLDLLRELDSGPLGLHPEVEAAIQNQETAFRMQSEVPAVGDLSSETDATKRIYGLEAEYGPTRSYGRQCLLARRLIERGVRFVQLTCPSLGHDRWDQHSNLEAGHSDNARAVDQPIAGLLKDLESRGLLDETLVVFTGEFGRTPVAQGRNGRDHDPHGFSLWMAGAGVAGGTIVGATDDYGLHAVEDVYEIHDLHATMLHLMGIDHKKLNVRHDSRDMRLTDVHGKLIDGVIA